MLAQERSDALTEACASQELVPNAVSRIFSYRMDVADAACSLVRVVTKFEPMSWPSRRAALTAASAELAVELVDLLLEAFFLLVVLGLQ